MFGDATRRFTKISMGAGGRHLCLPARVSPLVETWTSTLTPIMLLVLTSSVRLKMSHNLPLIMKGKTTETRAVFILFVNWAIFQAKWSENRDQKGRTRATWDRKCSPFASCLLDAMVVMSFASYPISKESCSENCAIFFNDESIYFSLQQLPHYKDFEDFFFVNCTPFEAS